MPRFARLTVAARDLVTKTRRRADDMPRLPFLISLAVSAALLAAAVESLSGVDERTTEVEEWSTETVDEFWSTEVEGVELELLEYGFGVIDDPQGEQRISLGAIIRNPTDAEAFVDSMLLSSLKLDGEVTNHEFYVGVVPPRAEVTVGLVLPMRAELVDIGSLELKFGEVTAFGFDPELTGEPGYAIPPPPEITMLGIEPTVAPEGHRLNYEITVSGDEDYAYHSVNLLFRDEEGDIVGGIPGTDDPFAYAEGRSNRGASPPGLRSSTSICPPATCRRGRPLPNRDRPRGLSHRSIGRTNGLAGPSRISSVHPLIPRKATEHGRLRADSGR
ncbi:hypothetical protein GCM10029992_63000 [Glycomyces albus]